MTPEVSLGVSANPKLLCALPDMSQGQQRAELRLHQLSAWHGFGGMACTNTQSTVDGVIEYTLQCQTARWHDQHLGSALTDGMTHVIKFRA